MVPFDDRDGRIWLDGRLVAWREAGLHVLTHGLHYASCVFEGERVYEGKIFRLRDHSNRLMRSAGALGFSLPWSIDDIDAATEEAVKAMKITNGYVRPLAWRGSEQMGVSPQNTTIHLAIAAWEWESYFALEAKMKGVRLHISEWARPAPNTAPTNAKAAGLYMIATLAKQAAEAAGCEDALLLDWRGRIAEATGANIFFSIGGDLHTPVADCFLDGITRQTVIELARSRQISVVERAMTLADLERVDEAFLTGTAAEVTPISEIGSFKFKPGPMCRLLIDDYRERVHA